MERALSWFRSNTIAALKTVCSGLCCIWCHGLQLTKSFSFQHWSERSVKKYSLLYCCSYDENNDALHLSE